MSKKSRRDFIKMSGMAAGLGAAGLASLGYQHAKAAPADRTGVYRPAAAPAAQTEGAALIDQVVENGVVRLGVDLTFPPLQFRDPQTNEPMGYCVDISKAIAADLGVEIEWVELPFGQLVPAMQAGQFDWSGIGLTITPQRAQAVRFISEPLFREDSILLVHNDFSLADTSELNTADVTFSNLAGSSQDASAKLAYPDATYRTFESQQDALLEVASGRAQVSLVAAWVAIPFIDENPNAPVYIWDGGPIIQDINTFMLPHGDEKTAFWLDNWMRYNGAHKLQDSLWVKWQAENLEKLEKYSSATG